MTYENDHLSVFHILHLYVVLYYKQRERKNKKKKENEFYDPQSVRQIEWKRLSTISLRINDSNDAVSPLR